MLLISVGACLVNPHHIWAFTAPSALGLSEAAGVFSRDGQFWALFISPLESGYFRPDVGLSVAGAAFFPLVVLGLASFAADQWVGRWSWERALVWIAFLALAVWRAAAIPFFAVVAGPIASLNFLDFAAKRWGTAPAVTGRAGAWAMGGRVLTFLAGVALLVAVWPGWLQAWPQEPHRGGWTVEPDPGLVRLTDRIKAWHKAGLPPGGRWFTVSPTVLPYLAWYCPGERGGYDLQRLPLYDHAAREIKQVRDSLAFRDGDAGKPDPRWRKALRSEDVHFLICYEQNPLPLRFGSPLPTLLTSPDEWPLLGVDGAATVFGWRDPRPWARASRARRRCPRPPPRRGRPSRRPIRPVRAARGLRGVRPSGGAGAAARVHGASRLVGGAVDADEAAPVGGRRGRSDVAALHGPATDLARSQRGGVEGHVGRAEARLAGRAGGRSLRDRMVALRLFPGRGRPPQAGPDRRDAASAPPHAESGRGVPARPARRLFDYGPPAPLYLSLRAARRALAVKPDAEAYQVLGEIYYRLVHETREGPFGAMVAYPRVVRGALQPGFPYPLLLRHVQAATALRRALDLDPNNAAAERLSIVLYQEAGFLDLTVQHGKECVRILRENGAPDAELAREVDQADKELRRRQDTYLLKTANRSVTEKVDVALDMGLRRRRWTCCWRPTGTSSPARNRTGSACSSGS